ncbi:hypothetical protein EMCRGX_G003256 [Ephydatia muelleri]
MPMLPTYSTSSSGQWQQLALCTLHMLRRSKWWRIAKANEIRATLDRKIDRRRHPEQMKCAEGGLQLYPQLIGNL